MTLILQQETVTGVATSSVFSSKDSSNPSLIIVRDPLGGVSFNVQVQNPENSLIWTSLTDNDTNVSQFAPTNNCTITMVLPSSSVKCRINQTAGTSASYQVIQ